MDYLKIYEEKEHVLTIPKICNLNFEKNGDRTL